MAPKSNDSTDITVAQLKKLEQLTLPSSPEFVRLSKELLEVVDKESLQIGAEKYREALATFIRSRIMVSVSEFPDTWAVYAQRAHDCTSDLTQNLLNMGVSTENSDEYAAHFSQLLERLKTQAKRAKAKGGEEMLVKQVKLLADLRPTKIIRDQLQSLTPAGVDNEADEVQVGALVNLYALILNEALNKPNGLPPTWSEFDGRVKLQVAKFHEIAEPTHKNAANDVPTSQLSLEAITSILNIAFGRVKQEAKQLAQRGPLLH